MTITDVESRRNKILEFIIQTYVETAEPVGSHEVCRRFHLRVSPATVRNVMGALEDDELLSHPHTSAGRIPTARGYRYYVDLLMTPQTLSDAELRAMAAFSHRAVEDPMTLLQEAARVLAVLTGQTALVLAPRLRQCTLRRIDLILVAPRRVLGLILTRDGMLQQAYLELDDPVEADELARLSRFLNEQLSGQVLCEIETRLQQALMDATNAFSYLYKQAHELWVLGGFVETAPILFVEGVSHLLIQPEFRQADQHQLLLEALELRQPVAALLEDTMIKGRRRVVIGVEHAWPGLIRCSVVSAPYRIGGRLAGAVGVLGPTRMDYGRVTSIVDQTSDEISRAMGRFLS